MRLVLLTLLTAVLAWGVWTFLGDSDEHVPEEPPVVEPPRTPPPDPENERAVNRAKLTTSTLVITVRDPKGKVPQGATAGYRYAGEDRLRLVNAQGKVRFTDAPLGTVTIVAKAPGFRADDQRHPLQAGVRSDVIFVLRPEGDGD